jgi:NADPH:quinone reductase-like Zn-dependent oxidoreductase
MNQSFNPNKTMTAVVNEHYGSPDKLDVRQLAIPEPESNAIRVKVHATTVGRTDSCALRAHPFFMRPITGWLRPKNPVLGFDFSGTVDAVGERVEGFQSGDRVFGLTPTGNGAHAQYLCIPTTAMVAHMPPDKCFAEVLGGEGAFYADTYMTALDLKPGDSILIYGASGAIGTAAVQLAKIRDCEVTAVVSTAHVELLRSLGADRVIDYTQEDFTQLGEPFDVVLDAVGKTTYSRCKSLLKSNGVFSATDLGPFYQNLLLPLWFRLAGRRRVIMPMPKQNGLFMPQLAQWMAQGKFQVVIDRHYPLEQIADAYRYVEQQQKQGVVVIDLL